MNQREEHEQFLDERAAQSVQEWRDGYLNKVCETIRQGHPMLVDREFVMQVLATLAAQSHRAMNRQLTDSIDEARSFLE